MQFTAAYTIELEFIYYKKSYTEYNKHIKEKRKSKKNEHREKNTEKKLKIKTRIFPKHTIKH